MLTTELQIRRVGQKRHAHGRLFHGHSSYRHKVPVLAQMTVSEVDNMLEEAIQQAKKGETYTTDEVRQSLEAEFGIKI